jgi:hypothetical protein
VKLTTTRRWDPRSGTLERHALGALKSELSNQRTSKKGERDGLAHEGYHREIRPERVDSPEEMHLHRGDADQRQDAAARELDELKRRIAGHELAPRVLACKADGIDKPADIARELGVPAAKVYAAIRVLKENLVAIRRAHGSRPARPHDPDEIDS